jgi:putative SOS response-associated peptidase YedK
MNSTSDVMCGRFVVSYTYEELLAFLKDDFELLDIKTDNQYPTFNIAPSTPILTIIKTRNGFKAGDIKWGFTINNHLLPNVRSETIETLFKTQINSCRCLIVASGYYEWNQSKIPYYFKTNHLLYFAGVYQKKGKEFQVVIITKNADNNIRDIHDRMPVILNSQEAKAYLQKNDILSIKNLLQTTNTVSAYQVSKQVNKVTNNTIQNIQQYEENTLF